MLGAYTFLVLLSGLATASNAASSFQSSPSPCSSKASRIASSPSSPAVSKTKSAHSHTASRTATHSKPGSKSHHSSRSHARSGSQAGSCAITTSTISSTRSPTTVVVTTVSTGYVNGDDGLVPCGSTSTYYSYTYLTTVTTAETYTQYPSSYSIIPPDSSVTIPAPSGFTPIQDSLPNAVYLNCQGGPDPIDNACPTPGRVIKRNERRKATCTITSTSTTILPSPTVTVTSTKYTTLIVFGRLSTTYDYATCTTYNDVATATRDITTTTAVVYDTSTVHITTQPVTTTTVYAACATNNFANAINPFSEDGKSHQLLYADTDEYTFHNYNTASPYECCAIAFQGGAQGVWTWYPQGPEEFGFPGECNLIFIGDKVCTVQSDNVFGAIVGNDTGILSTVMGNSPCGEFGRSHF